MRMRKVALSAAVVLGVAVCVSVVPPAGAKGSSSATVGGKRVAYAEGSPALGTQSLAGGQLLTEKGQAASAASVELYAWPSNDVTAKMNVGETANMQLVASTTTNADGVFSVGIADNSLLAPLAGEDRLVNFTIFAVQGSSVADFSFGRTLSPVDGGFVLAEVGDGQPTKVAASLDLELTLDGGGKVRGPDESGEADYSDLTVVDETAPFQKGCTSKIIQNYGSRWTIVGQHYSITDHVLTGFEYARGSSSALGVASSTSGQYGTFKVSGTSAKSSTGTLLYPTAGSYAKQVRRTLFTYVKWRHMCIGQGGATTVSYQVRAHSWDGGTQTLSGRWYPFADYCSPYEPRSGYVKQRTLAFEWSNGVQVGSAIGIDLSSRTGYSYVTSLTFFNAAYYSVKKLCGLYAKATDDTRASRMQLWKDFG